MELGKNGAEKEWSWEGIKLGKNGPEKEWSWEGIKLGKSSVWPAHEVNSIKLVNG